MSVAKSNPFAISSLYVPTSTTSPSSRTTMESAFGRYCSAFVTSTRVAFFMNDPAMTVPG
jgi:hypothetical protein